MGTKKYLIQDGDIIKKSAVEGLEVIDGQLNSQLFDEHGTDYLPDIIGEYDREVAMSYKEDLGDRKIYGYELVGYTDIESLATNTMDGNLYNQGNNSLSNPLIKDTSSAPKSTIIFNENDIGINTSHGNTINNHGAVVTNFSVDLTNVEKIEVEWECIINGTKIYMCIDKNQMDSKSLGERNIIKESNTGLNVSIKLTKDYLDVSELQGEYFIRVGMISRTGETGFMGRFNLGGLKLLDYNGNTLQSHNLLKSNNKCYYYQEEQFIEVEPTESNFEEFSVDLTKILSPNIKGVKPLMTLENPEIIHLADKENPKLYIKGFRDLRPVMESENPKLLINSATDPQINVIYHPDPQLIIPTGDITLKMLDKIYNFTIYSNKNSSGDIKIIFSVDEGVNWLTYNLDTDNFEEIDITRIKEVKEKGIDPDTFNSINEKWNEVITNNKVRFAYYLEIESINDIAAVDKLEINMDMHGKWKKAKHGIDYHYKYDNDHLYVSFFTDGSYKINHQG